jgi:hypothetical protein
MNGDLTSQLDSSSFHQGSSITNLTKPMKKSFVALLTAGAIAFGVAGCKKEEKVDTAALQSAFAGAPADIKEQIDKAVTALGANDFKTAISAMANVMGKSNQISPAQMDALGHAFVAANVIVTTRGAAQSAAEAKANADKLKAQSGGSQ